MAKNTTNTTALVPVETPTLKVINGHGMATSLQVAERFQKRHDTVLRAIRNLECSADFNRRNFAAVEYMDAKGESRPMVEMTRDGFVMLAMGFTGPQAMAWKESFIEAFNQLEQAYLEQLQNTAQKALMHREFRKNLKLADRIKLRESAAALLDDLLEETQEGKRAQKWLWLQDVHSDLGIETIPMDRLFDQEGGAA